jgi:hypothetical protein
MSNWVIPLVATLAVFVVAVIILNRLFGEKRYKIEPDQADAA